ncbi:hypothetical protein [Breznakia pachnodae]|uniref:Uncharacterized protein n=1 Tax=Breznakia pachnodae TaxID=265178 RepID=A0ABU0E4L9_9FIRM|nr:hypothetical protein [Breznakia pachnodae]MDQ0361825.1 hypothetical protein [Breznakia pachnodae]
MIFKKYAIKKILINFVLVNIVINGFFYYFNFRNYEGPLYLQSIKGDLLFGLVMLALLCAYTGFINTQKDVLTGTFYEEDLHFKLSKYLPKTLTLRLLAVILFVSIIVYPMFITIPNLLGVNEINHTIGFLIKTGSAALAAAVIGYFVITLSISDYKNLSNKTY